MKVLFCGPKSSTLDFLRETEEVIQTEFPVGQIAETVGAEIIVSHGYRRIISSLALSTTPAVNLHIGFLPWNRGAHPNFWSIYEGTPGGVTVHHMNEGVDAGPIIAQRRVEPEPTDTLRTSYERLQHAVTDLFIDHWPEIREGTVETRPQTAPPGYTPGSWHPAQDLPDLRLGWDTPVAELRGSGIEGARRLVCH